MFKKKFQKKEAITFQDDIEIIQPKIIIRNSLNSFDDLDDEPKIKKIIKSEHKLIDHNKPQSNQIIFDLTQLQEENRLNNQMALQNMNNYIDLEQQPNEIIDLDDLDQNIITDSSNQRLKMIGIAKQEKLFYNDNSDDEEFRRLQNTLMKSNRIQMKDNIDIGHKAFAFNDTNQMHYCSFMDTFKQINLEQIIGNLKLIISQEQFYRDKLANEINRSEEAIKSSKQLISMWQEQNTEIAEQLREFEITNEYFQSFNDMIKQKTPLLFKYYDDFDETKQEYSDLIKSRLEEETMEFKNIFEGLPQEILLNYAKDICLHMEDVDEEFLDINKITSNYIGIMFVEPNIQVLQPIFDYHILMRFIQNYNDEEQSEDIFEDLISDSYILCQLILKCKFIKGLITLNPVYPKFIQSFIRCIIKYTYKYLKNDALHQDESSTCLVWIKSLLEVIVKTIGIKDNKYKDQIQNNLIQMYDILPKDTLDKLCKQTNN